MRFLLEANGPRPDGEGGKAQSKLLDAGIGCGCSLLVEHVIADAKEPSELAHLVHSRLQELSVVRIHAQLLDIQTFLQDRQPMAFIQTFMHLLPITLDAFIGFVAERVR